MAATKDRKTATTTTKREKVEDGKGNVIGWIIQKGKGKWQPYVSMGSGRFGQPLPEQKRKKDAIDIVVMRNTVNYNDMELDA